MKKSLLGLSVVLLSQAVAANNLLVIGVKSDGEEQVHQTKMERVEEALLKANLERKRLALEVLEKNNDQSQWKLSKFSLGLGVEGEAGIGPWNLGLAIKQRLFLKKSSKAQGGI